MPRVLVVDDDLTTQFMMAEVLETLGYRCDVVGSARDCLDALERAGEGYDLVLLDLHMPGMDGLAAARAIRAAPDAPLRAIPIVAVTADVAFHRQAAVSAYGMTDVLPKPIDLSALDLAIQKHAT